eukprot:1946732-Prymnesium_polylepis.1
MEARRRRPARSCEVALDRVSRLVARLPVAADASLLEAAWQPRLVRCSVGGRWHLDIRVRRSGQHIASCTHDRASLKALDAECAGIPRPRGMRSTRCGGYGCKTDTRARAR